ncbi:MAG: ATP-binding protein [Rhabdochlamydiaceae bacterium]|nr:ATP-binding protein [Rhabdochlamydiaceae bacterium]
MDKVSNPFSPGAGSRPHELVGRSPVLEQARVLLARVKQKRPEKSLLLTGLRGVGKTVLLNEIKRSAEEAGYQTILIEAHENKSLGCMLVPYLRSVLFSLDRIAGTSDKIRRGWAVFKSFLSSLKITVDDVTYGVEISPERGTADSGDLEIDLPNLFVAIGEAAEDRKRGVAVLIDEIQYLEEKELGALIMAMHKIQQNQLPIVLLGAGLPILPELAGDSKSYAERLFDFPSIGELSEEDAMRALQEPTQSMGIIFENLALKEIFSLTKGYPYFLQEWGYQIWNLAVEKTISLQTVHEATALAIQRLDSSFFRVRFDRLTMGEKKFLRIMAQLGPGPHRTADVAEALGIKIASLGPRRAKLIKKGMIYSPSHGDMAFTVPLFDQFMIRAMPESKLPHGNSLLLKMP